MENLLYYDIATKSYIQGYLWSANYFDGMLYMGDTMKDI
jgi:hypothetical protein